ncbi:MAG: aminopeptidase [Methanobacteriota archaeon]|nr:MAG: aminopeptidase [Euryarchaeota archaeon]
MKPEVAAENALTCVMEAVAGERIVVIYDDVLSEVGEAFAYAALEMGLWTRQVVLGTSKTRKAIPPELREIIVGERPDIFVNVFRGPSEETPFRIAVTKLQTRKKLRLGHCPGIALDMLTEGAMALTGKQYKKMQDFSRRLLRTLSSVNEISVASPGGTDLTMNIKDRRFFADTFFNWKTMKWINLPVGEVAVGPVENSLEGTLVSEGAIGGVGLIEHPVKIQVSAGKAGSPKTDEPRVRKKVNQALKTDDWSNIVGELGIGLNPKARFCDEFLEIEKIAGTCHIAFGNNLDFPGGQNPSANHMDYLITDPTIEIESRAGTEKIMSKGNFLLD